MSSGAKLSREVSGLTSILDKMKKKYRDIYEKISDVHKQCEEVIGEPNDDTKCWLCGFKLHYINELTQSDHFKQIIKVPRNAIMMDNPTCEHVLPIKLGFSLLTLYQENVLQLLPKNFEEILHTEYEYAHNLCNYAKKEKYFLTWKDYSEGRDFCSLEVDYDKIGEFLNYLLKYKQDGPKRSSFITFKFPASFWKSTPKEFTYTSPNLVEANLILEAHSRNIEWFADEDAKNALINEWKYKMTRYISSKLEGLVEYIKFADGCGTNSIGEWSSGLYERMQGAKKASGPAPAPNFAPRRGSADETREAVNTLLSMLELAKTESSGPGGGAGAMINEGEINSRPGGGAGAMINEEGYTSNNSHTSSGVSSVNTTLSNAQYIAGPPSNNNTNMKGGRGRKRHTKRRKVAKRKYRRTTRK